VAQTIQADQGRSRRDVIPPQGLLEGAAVRLLATYWGSLVVVDATRRLGAPVTIGSLAVLVGVCCVHERRVVAAGLAAVAWSFATGFVTHQGGDLTVIGGDDLARLVLLVAVATLVATSTHPHFHPGRARGPAQWRHGLDEPSRARGRRAHRRPRE
jgi:hypothetical protein